MNWKSLVGSVAPMLGTALGGPFGGMAGKWLAGELGVDEADLEDQVVNANPDLMFKIKELDGNFKIEMKRLGLEESRLHVEDRASARTMAANTTLLPQAIISAIFIAGFIAVLYSVFSSSLTLEGSTKDAAMILLGILSAGITQILNFFFGSSSGSKEKTKQLINNSN